MPPGWVTVVPADTQLALAPQVSPTVAWPASLPSFRIRLLDAQWTQAGSRVKATVMLSWDGGQTFPYQKGYVWEQGAKDRAGGSPGAAIGPFRGEDGVLNNPTHGKWRFEADAGAPTCGLEAVQDT